MRKPFSVLLLLIAFATGFVSANIASAELADTAIAKDTVDSATKARISEAYGKLPLTFEINRGQTDSQVDFISRGAGYSLFLSPTSAVMVLNTRKPETAERERERERERENQTGFPG